MLKSSLEKIYFILLCKGRKMNEGGAKTPVKWFGMFIYFKSAILIEVTILYHLGINLNAQEQRKL